MGVFYGQQHDERLPPRRDLCALIPRRCVQSPDMLIDAVTMQDDDEQGREWQRGLN